MSKINKFTSHLEFDGSYADYEVELPSYMLILLASCNPKQMITLKVEGFDLTHKLITTFVFKLVNLTMHSFQCCTTHKCWDMSY